MNVLERFPTLRQSRLATFDSCALRAFFEESYRRDWSGHPQARGQIVHRVLARALKEMHADGARQIDTEVILQLLFDELRMSGQELVNCPMEQVKDMRWVVVKFATDNTDIDITNLVDVEHRLDGTVSYENHEGHLVHRILTGQLDAAFVVGEQDEEMVVLDWKDTWDLPSPAELGFEGYFQQRFYAWLVMRNYASISRVTLREFYLRYSESREATVYREDLEYIEAELAAVACRFDRAFAQEEFPPSPGRHCQLCPRPGACPIFPDVRVEGMITDEASARKVAGEANVARAALKQRELALRAWASVHGAIPINSTPGRERVWGFRSTTRTSRPKKEDLQRALAERKPLDLDALYKESLSTRFEPHVPKKHEDTPEDAKLMNALQESLREAQGGAEEAA